MSRFREVRTGRVYATSVQDYLGNTPLTDVQKAARGVSTALNAVVLGATAQSKMITPGGFIDPGRGRIEIFDDFTYETLATTGVGRGDWIVFAGTDGDATVGVVNAEVPEGQILMGTGDGDATEDGSVLSLIKLAQGSLVSLGMTVFETKVSFDQLTGTSWNFGLSDTLATDGEENLHVVNSGTIADGGLTVDDVACFALDSDATAVAKWQICSENGGTIYASAAEEALAIGPTADTYAVLRIEVDASGDARFYIDGVLVSTHPLAVATTAILIPWIGGNGAVDAQVNTVVSVDYIYFSHARPTSNA